MSVRACDGCTACCFLLEVPDVPTPCFEQCPHQREGVGCAVYDQRPEPCADFGCLWIDGKAPMFVDDPSDRPDNLGMAFFLFPKSPVPGRPCVVAYELRENAVLQQRAVELIEEMGKLRPVAIIQHETHETVIRYPDDMREMMRDSGKTIAVDRTE